MQIDKETYMPHGDTVDILDRALQLVRSVPYQVSARWLFYRLLQEGRYSSKSDYSNKWLKVVSRARHAFFRGWKPDTLADETREAIYRGHGFRSAVDWLKGVGEQVECDLSVWYTQEYYVELWFEARAMIDQFRYYTERLTLRPMGGQPSIPYKWQTAQELSRYSQRYKKPIVILYFGDLDAGGELIEAVTRDDVSKWCKSSFEFVRCGLNPEHPAQYSIPENFERPGEYQWEALSDDAARELITFYVNRYMRHDALLAISEIENLATKRFRDEILGVAEEWDEDPGMAG